jgi:hypothetical protein
VQVFDGQIEIQIESFPMHMESIKVTPVFSIYAKTIPAETTCCWRGIALGSFFAATRTT